MSFFNYRDIQLPIADQPQAIPVLEKNFDASLENNYDYHHDCEHGQTLFSEHHNSHNSIQLRRFLLPAIFALVALGSLLAWSCANWYDWGPWGGDLIGRTLQDGDNKNSTPNTDSTDKLSVLEFLSHIWMILVLAVVLVFALTIFFVTGCCCPKYFHEFKIYCCCCYVCGYCKADECIANLCACCIKDGDTLGGGRKYQPDQLEQSEPRIAAVPYASGDRASDDPRYRHNDRRWVPPLSNIEMQQRPTKGEAKKANYQ